jgi:glycosyltransferase involved in cell wall biosynthesis
MDNFPKPLVSVVIITYMHENFIAEAIEGVLMQDIDFDVELIIADDCSPDRTAEIVQKFINNHPNSHWIRYHRHENNKGVMSNFIWALKQAKGQFIALCEGDDYWTDPHKLQKQVDFLEANEDYVMSFHDASKIDKHGKVIEEDYLGPSNQNDVSSDDLIRYNVYTPTLTMCFRNVIKEIPIEFKSVQLGDAFLISLLGNYGKAKYMDNISRAMYRIHESGIWSMIETEKKILINRIARKTISKYYGRIGNKEIASYFKEKQIESSQFFMKHALNNRLINMMPRAYWNLLWDKKLYFHPIENIKILRTIINYLVVQPIKINKLTLKTFFRKLVTIKNNTYYSIEEYSGFNKITKGFFSFKLDEELSLKYVDADKQKIEKYCNEINVQKVYEKCTSFFVGELNDVLVQKDKDCDLIFDKKYNLLWFLSFHTGYMGVINKVDIFDHSSEVIKLNGKTLVLSAPGAGYNYFHWLLDLLPRLGYLSNLGYFLTDFDRIIINTPKLNFHLESLNMINFPIEKLFFTESKLTYQLEHAILPSYSPQSMLGFQFVKQTFAKSKSPLKNRRVFITRRNATKRRIVNEEEIFAFLKGLNFEMIELEKLNLHEQIVLFSETEIVVGAHGAGFSNIIFMSPGTKVVEFIDEDRVSILYWILANYNRSEYGVVFAQRQGVEDIHVSLSKLESVFRLLLK